MDFYSNPKRLQTIRKVLFFAFIILLVVNIFNSFVNNEINYLGICANSLMAISMLVQIRKYQREKNSNDSQH